MNTHVERKLNAVIDEYVKMFKKDVMTRASHLGLVPLPGSSDVPCPKLMSLLQYVCDYDTLVVDRSDFAKSVRIKNSVFHGDRCSALRANGEQCTRRRRDDSVYCGTHAKGTPHGTCQFQTDGSAPPVGHKVEVWSQDIQGIIYYIDKSGNVYQTEDVMKCVDNPKVIANYEKTGDVYTIIPYASGDKILA